MSENLIRWAGPTTLTSQPERGKKRHRKEAWEPYKRLMVDLRRNGDTAEKIQSSLADEGFVVDITALRRKLRDWEPKNKKQQPSFQITGKSFKDTSPQNSISTILRKKKPIRDAYLESSPSGFPNNHASSKEISDDTLLQAYEIMDFEAPDGNEAVTNSGDSGDSQIWNILVYLGIDTNEEAMDGDSIFTMEIFGDDYQAGVDDILPVAKRIQTRFIGSSDAEGQAKEPTKDTTNTPNIVPSMPNISNIDTDSHIGSTKTTTTGVLDNLGPDNRPIHSTGSHEKRYGPEEILALVEDLPNWWSNRGPPMPDPTAIIVDIRTRILALRSDHDHLLEALATLNTISCLQDPTVDWEDKLAGALAVLHKFPSLELESYYLQAYIYFTRSGRMIDRADFDQAFKYTESAVLAFRKCSELRNGPHPFWFHALWIYIRGYVLQLKRAPGLFPIENELIELKYLLCEVETVNFLMESVLKLRIVILYLGRHLESNNCRYLPAMEKLLELMRSGCVGAESGRQLGIAIHLLKYHFKNGEYRKCIELIVHCFKQEKRGRLHLRIMYRTTLLLYFGYVLALYRGQYAQARAILLYIIKIIGKHFGHESHMNVLLSWSHLGRLYMLEKKFKEALVISERVLGSSSVSKKTVLDPGSLSSKSLNFLTDYRNVYLQAEETLVLALNARGLVLYAQPVADDLVRRYKSIYSPATGDDDAWGAILKALDTHTILQILHLLPPITG